MNPVEPLTVQPRRRPARSRKLKPVLFMVVYTVIMAAPLSLAMVGTQALGGQSFVEIFVGMALLFGISGCFAGMIASSFASERLVRVWKLLLVFTAAGVVGAAVMSLGFAEGWWFGSGCGGMLLFYGIGGIVLPGLLGLWIVDSE